MSFFKLFCDDCLVAVPHMGHEVFDTIITDPPYGLSFMGKEWDSRGTAFSPEVWSMMLHAAKPGAHLVCFGGTRTYHRITCAIEDAGWNVRDCLVWLYAQGMPKSLRIGAAVDGRLGAERHEVVGRYQPPGMEAEWNLTKAKDERTVKVFASSRNNLDILAPATSEGAKWEGWGTSLKPSWEPIILAMKPIEGTYAENALTHGVAGLNIDGSRLDYVSEADRASATPQGTCAVTPGCPAGKAQADRVCGSFERPEQKGRWPANVLLEHDPRCVCVGEVEDEGYTINRFTDGAKPFGGGAGHEYKTTRVGGGKRQLWACVPSCPVRMLDAQTGTLKSGVMRREQKRKKSKGRGGYHDGFPDEVTATGTYGDAGGASRFFYCGKANPSERNAGLPEGLENKHPTVKPLHLMKWLCRLTATPDGGMVLDPFMGSGTTGIACRLTGRSFVGIEQDRDYYQVARARIAGYPYEG